MLSHILSTLLSYFFNSIMHLETVSWGRWRTISAVYFPLLLLPLYQICIIIFIVIIFIIVIIIIIIIIFNYRSPLTYELGFSWFKFTFCTQVRSPVLFRADWSPDREPALLTASQLWIPSLSRLRSSLPRWRMCRLDSLWGGPHLPSSLLS